MIANEEVSRIFFRDPGDSFSVKVEREQLPLFQALVKAGILDETGLVIAALPPFPEIGYSESIGKVCRTPRPVNLYLENDVIKQLPTEFKKSWEEVYTQYKMYEKAPEVATIELVGSGVFHLLGVQTGHAEKVLKDLFRQFSINVPLHLEGLNLNPADYDLRWEIPSAHENELDIAATIITEIFENIVVKNWVIHTGANEYSLVATAHTTQPGTEFIFVHNLVRKSLFTYGDLRMQFSSLTEDRPKVHFNGSCWQGFFDGLFKILRVENPFEVNDRGWFKLIAKKCQGWRVAAERNDEKILLENALKGRFDRNMKKLLPETPKERKVFLFNACFSLSRFGFAQKADELWGGDFQKELCHRSFLLSFGGGGDWQVDGEQTILTNGRIQVPPLDAKMALRLERIPEGFVLAPAVGPLIVPELLKEKKAAKFCLGMVLLHAPEGEEAATQWLAHEEKFRYFPYLTLDRRWSVVARCSRVDGILMPFYLDCLAEMRKDLMVKAAVRWGIPSEFVASHREILENFGAPEFIPFLVRGASPAYLARVTESTSFDKALLLDDSQEMRETLYKKGKPLLKLLELAYRYKDAVFETLSEKVIQEGDIPSLVYLIDVSPSARIWIALLEKKPSHLTKAVFSLPPGERDQVMRWALSHPIRENLLREYLRQEGLPPEMVSMTIEHLLANHCSEESLKEIVKVVSEHDVLSIDYEGLFLALSSPKLVKQLLPCLETVETRGGPLFSEKIAEFLFRHHAYGQFLERLFQGEGKNLTTRWLVASIVIRLAVDEGREGFAPFLQEQLEKHGREIRSQAPLIEPTPLSHIVVAFTETALVTSLNGKAIGDSERYLDRIEEVFLGAEEEITFIYLLTLHRFFSLYWGTPGSEQVQDLLKYLSKRLRGHLELFKSREALPPRGAAVLAGYCTSERVENNPLVFSEALIGSVEGLIAIPEGCSLLDAIAAFQFLGKWDHKIGIRLFEMTSERMRAMPGHYENVSLLGHLFRALATLLPADQLVIYMRMGVLLLWEQVHAAYQLAAKSERKNPFVVLEDKHSQELEVGLRLFDTELKAYFHYLESRFSDLSEEQYLELIDIFGKQIVDSNNYNVYKNFAIFLINAQNYLNFKKIENPERILIRICYYAETLRKNIFRRIRQLAKQDQTIQTQISLGQLYLIFEYLMEQNSLFFEKFLQVVFREKRVADTLGELMLNQIGLISPLKLGAGSVSRSIVLFLPTGSGGTLHPVFENVLSRYFVRLFDAHAERTREDSPIPSCLTQLIDLMFAIETDPETYPLPSDTRLGAIHVMYKALIEQITILNRKLKVANPTFPGCFSFSMLCESSAHAIALSGEGDKLKYFDLVARLSEIYLKMLMETNRPQLFNSVFLAVMRIYVKLGSHCLDKSIVDFTHVLSTYSTKLEEGDVLLNAYLPILEEIIKTSYCDPATILTYLQSIQKSGNQRLDQLFDLYFQSLSLRIVKGARKELFFESFAILENLNKEKWALLKTHYQKLLNLWGTKG